MPAMAPPDMDLEFVDCEPAELELRLEMGETLPAVLVVAVTVVSAGVLELTVLTQVESELEVAVDEEACENNSASTSSKHTKP